VSPALIDRMGQIEALSLLSGSHEDFEDGMCVMEAVAYVAGEPWSDSPTCACPVISAFLRAWNDSLSSDAERDRLLKPLIPQLIDTRSTKTVEEKRSYLVLDWLVRVYTPKWLDLVPALAPHALALRNLEDIADMAGAVVAGKRTRAASATCAAAVDGYAAMYVRLDAGRAAAAAVGYTAVCAGWYSEWDAAGAAAGVAHAAAAAAAARAALKPTTEWLQASALDLVARMIAVKE
jgi:hypothetical protein